MKIENKTADSQSLPPLPEPHVLNGHYRDHVDSVNGFSLSQLEEYGDARAAHARKAAPAQPLQHNKETAMSEDHTAEREAFEAWYSAEDQETDDPERTYELTEEGMNELTKYCVWQGWQARAAAPAQPSAQDAEDAKRYRLLRHGQHWSVISDISDDLRCETLDYAIDAVIAQQGEAP